MGLTESCKKQVNCESTAGQRPTLDWGEVVCPGRSKGRLAAPLVYRPPFAKVRSSEAGGLLMVLAWGCASLVKRVRSWERHSILETH